MNEILVNRVAFSIFGMEVYWYGIFITTGILAAFLLAFLLAKRRGLTNNLPYEIIIAILPLGILGARLFSVLFDADLGIADFFKFREGGMSIIGAVIGGAIGVGVLCLIRKHNFLEIADLLCTVLILAQAIGRWGNFFNSELYGQEIVNPALQKFPLAVEIDGKYYEALFFYESVLNLLGFAGLMCIYWFVRIKGVAMGAYFLHYGIVRFVLEPRRQAEYILRLGDIPVSRLMSLVMIIIGVATLVATIVVYFVKKKKGKVIASER